MFQNHAELSTLEAERTQSPLYKHVAKTYLWMFLGLTVTFATGAFLYLTGLIAVFFATWWLPFAMLIAQLALVVGLSSRLAKISVGACRAIFLGYSLLTGITIGSVLLIYDAGAAMLAFGVAALFFGVMAAAGLITKRDVSGFAPLITVGLVTLLVMQLIAMFLSLSTFDTLICFAGIALFLGITTYDAKKTKDYFYAFEGNQAMLDKVSIYSALNLYLDFINLFLYLVRLMGRRR